MFQNKTIIVTGAANGIGKTVALHFANKGGNVILADKDATLGKELEKAIGKENVIFMETDVKNEADIIKLTEWTVQKFGTIDVLVNNAGISGFMPLFDLSVSEWDNVINTNLRSVFICSKEAARYMKHKGGAIINMASTRAFMSEPNSESYAASKGGIIALTHALAASLSEYRIRVNSISPGWIHTGDQSELSEQDHEQHWSKRVGTPDDIARACLFLADSDNAFITGQNITIDGGMTKKMIYEE